MRPNIYNIYSNNEHFRESDLLMALDCYSNFSRIGLLNITKLFLKAYDK